MDDPVSEIPLIIYHLTETPPSVQQETIETFFTPDAQFNHPFCRTLQTGNSRYQISRIYRWYKILSPRISARVHSVSWDERNRVIYVGITQVFAIWAIPTHKAEVSLVTVLHLVQGDENAVDGTPPPMGDIVEFPGLPHTKRKGKWYIKSQNDLYQPDQFVKFLAPPLAWLIPVFQLFATLVCIICSYLFGFVTFWEEKCQTDFLRPEAPPKWDDAK